jgi:hypothetical protein
MLKMIRFMSMLVVLLASLTVTKQVAKAAPSPTCGAVGSGCSVDSDCCYAGCFAGHCACSNSGCDQDNDCCNSGAYCAAGQCQQYGSGCTANGGGCGGNLECCSNNCCNGSCSSTTCDAGPGCQGQGCSGDFPWGCCLQNQFCEIPLGGAGFCI